MKKIYALVLAAALLLLGTQAKAQFHIGVGYLNSTEITRFNDGTNPFRETMHGFYLGGTFNFKVAGDFGIAPGFYIDALFQEEVYNELPAYYQKRFAGFSFKNGIYAMYAALWNAAKVALAENLPKETFEGTVIPNGQFKYKTDYDLGDVVRIENKYGISADARIIEVIESIDENGENLSLSFENKNIKMA